MNEQATCDRIHMDKGKGMETGEFIACWAGAQEPGKLEGDRRLTGDTEKGKESSPPVVYFAFSKDLPYSGSLPYIVDLCRSG